MNGLGQATFSGNKRYSMVKCPFHDDKHASAAVYHDGKAGPWFICYACHTSMPLGEALKKVGIEDFDYEHQNDTFDLDLFCDSFVLRSPSDRALHYLAKRGIEVESLPPYVGSTDKDNGVAFAFGLNGKYVGAQVRVFPEMQWGDVRYALEGKRTPFFGKYEAWRRGEYGRLLVVEKAFGTLKVQQASDKFDLGIAAICSAGSNMQRELFDYVDSDTTFLMDNDMAGRKAADRIKRLGYRVMIPTTPIDDWTIEKIGDVLRRTF